MVNPSGPETIVLPIKNNQGNLTALRSPGFPPPTTENQYLCTMKYRQQLSLRNAIIFINSIFLWAILSGCANKAPHTGVRVVIETRFGDIEAELYPEKAPATVAAFLRNVDSGYYHNTSFYRVLREDNQVSGTLHSHLVQGGLWKARPELERRLPLIPHEPTNKTGLHHMAGALSMARNTPGTASSEFFICLKDEPGFDHGGENNPDGEGYAVFGKVISGMETVRQVYRQPEYDQQFTPPVIIVDIKRLK